MTVTAGARVATLAPWAMWPQIGSSGVAASWRHWRDSSRRSARARRRSCSRVRPASASRRCGAPGCGRRQRAVCAFAGLGELLGGSRDGVLDLLPPPQADALRVALLLERPRGAPPGERVIAAAALSAVRALSAQRPTVVAIDDMQWLDSPSAAVLGYAWRRLRDERVG